MAIAMCHYGLYPIYTVRLSPTQHTDIEPEPAAADLRRAVRQDVRGPPGRVLLLGAPGLRRHRREETRARAGHGGAVCVCQIPGFKICEVRGRK